MVVRYYTIGHLKILNNRLTKESLQVRTNWTPCLILLDRLNIENGSRMAEVLSCGGFRDLDLSTIE